MIAVRRLPRRDEIIALSSEGGTGEVYRGRDLKATVTVSIPTSQNQILYLPAPLIG